jgi:hypothetical protein
VKVFAWYQFKTGLGTTNIGVNQLALSGTPDSTTVIYLSAPTFPFGRGDLGRTPTYTQTDLTLAHAFKLGKNRSLRFEANVRNLFDQDSVISRVTQINRTSAISLARLPLSKFFAGYNVYDYIGANNPSVAISPIYGQPSGSYRAGQGGGLAGDSSAYAARYPNFGGYQDFRTIRLGVTLTF